MFGDLGVPEVLFILGIALLIFGPRKLGDLGKGLGEGIRGFQVGAATTAYPGTKEGRDERNYGVIQPQVHGRSLRVPAVCFCGPTMFRLQVTPNGVCPEPLARLSSLPIPWRHSSY